MTNGKGGYAANHAVVGSYLPNVWWLYDMHGNVSECCLDWFGDLSSGGPDTVGSSSGGRRVERGGDWYFRAHLSTSSSRASAQSSGCGRSVGFRLAKTLSR